MSKKSRKSIYLLWLGISTLFPCTSAIAQSCVTYQPNPATFPFFSPLGGAVYTTVASVTLADGTVEPPVTTTEPLSQTGPGAIVWFDPQSLAEGLFGSVRADSLFKSCDGVFPSAGPQTTKSTSSDGKFSVALTISSANGFMTITVQGTIITPDVGGVCPGTCLLDVGSFNTSYIYNIKTGAYTIAQSSSEHTNFVDTNGNTTDSITTFSGSASGLWPLIQSQLQITTSSLPGGQSGVAYDAPLSATGGTPFPLSCCQYEWDATNLPPGLFISFFSGEIYGLPAVPGPYFTHVTVKDSVGTTVSNTFQIIIAPSFKQSAAGVVQNTYFALLAQYWADVAAHYYELAAQCRLVAAAQPELQPLCYATLAEAYGFAYLADLDWTKAGDPADPNYKVIAQPVPPSIAIPAPSPGWTAAQLAAYNTLKTVLSTQEQIMGLSNAEITSVNRAGGAYQAGDANWLQEQLAAQERYTYLEAFDLQLLLAQIAQLKTIYAASGFPDFSVGPDEAEQFEQDVAANGVPADLKQQLSALDVDADGLTLLQKALSSPDPSTISGDILQSFGPPPAVATAIHQLAASIITQFSAFAPKVEIDSLNNTFEMQVPFTLGTGSDGINPVTEDVSFSLGSFAVTIPAGSFRMTGKGFYQFSGSINGGNLEAIVKPTTTGYQLQAEGSGGLGANLGSLANPLVVAVFVGNDGGTASVSAETQ